MRPPDHSGPHTPWPLPAAGRDLLPCTGAPRRPGRRNGLCRRGRAGFQGLPGVASDLWASLSAEAEPCGRAEGWGWGATATPLCEHRLQASQHHRHSAMCPSPRAAPAKCNVGLTSGAAISLEQPWGLDITPRAGSCPPPSGSPWSPSIQPAWPPAEPAFKEQNGQWASSAG